MIAHDITVFCAGLVVGFLLLVWVMPGSSATSDRVAYTCKFPTTDTPAR